MILEVSAENLRDIAAALNGARKRAPDVKLLEQLEVMVLRALRQRTTSLELDDQQAQSLRNVLLQRAWDQRSTSEAYDYSDLAERIGRALDEVPPPLVEHAPDSRPPRPDDP